MVFVLLAWSVMSLVKAHVFHYAMSTIVSNVPHRTTPARSAIMDISFPQTKPITALMAPMAVIPPQFVSLLVTKLSHTAINILAQIAQPAHTILVLHVLIIIPSTHREPQQITSAVFLLSTILLDALHTQSFGQVRIVAILYLVINV